MNVIGTILRKLEDALHLLGCLGLLVVVVLINADILMRLVLHVPVQFQFELTELYLMPALATLSLSRVFRDGGHLALDFVPEHLPGVPGVVVDKLRLLLPALFFGLVVWMSGKFALHAFQRGEVEYGVVDWPLGWAYAIVPLGCGVLVLRLIYDALTREAPAQV
ncbi:TRAP transporter small permease [Alloyangia pacifica]|uniref:TRAP transporter small permease protein n=1 Tax=Alloyangia pacifica TaxID=311180 RepID=A0A1I6VRV3_9RHOB|nr:TRAP transporter small permease [Alloyangia pacifica]SDI11858.1 TRAP-type C4-dicarboxylate transport system, small permease component [Alloyangia pacifica]SFT16445.1 TRAP-type C4-dicarboxylate transport system, small permease component [Alloyangia pacifica]